MNKKYTYLDEFSKRNPAFPKAMIMEYHKPVGIFGERAVGKEWEDEYIDECEKREEL